MVVFFILHQAVIGVLLHQAVAVVGPISQRWQFPQQWSLDCLPDSCAIPELDPHLVDLPHLLDVGWIDDLTAGISSPYLGNVVVSKELSIDGDSPFQTLCCIDVIPLLSTGAGRLWYLTCSVIVNVDVFFSQLPAIGKGLITALDEGLSPLFTLHILSLGLGFAIFCVSRCGIVHVRHRPIHISGLSYGNSLCSLTFSLGFKSMAFFVITNACLHMNVCGWINVGW